MSEKEQTKKAKEPKIIQPELTIEDCENLARIINEYARNQENVFQFVNMVGNPLLAKIETAVKAVQDA